MTKQQVLEENKTLRQALLAIAEQVDDALDLVGEEDHELGEE